MKYFEFVCSRNEGRSPVAEFIAQTYLEKLGIAHEYAARSSGSHRINANPNEVQSTADANVPFESLVALIKLGTEQKIFSSKDEEKIAVLVDEQNSEELKYYFGLANRIFKDHERHFRADAVHRLVEEHELKGYLKAHSDQTVPYEDTIAIFPMAAANTEKVREIYEGTGLNPIIETLSTYANGEELPNAFARGEDFYHNVIDQLYLQIPKVIDRALKELAV